MRTYVLTSNRRDNSSTDGFCLQPSNQTLRAPVPTRMACRRCRGTDRSVGSCRGGWRPIHNATLHQMVENKPALRAIALMTHSRVRSRVFMEGVMTSAVAHVSTPGLGTFMPAESARERERVVAHVANCLVGNALVQVLYGEHHWLVGTCPPTDRCASCGDTGLPVCQTNSGTARCCLRCAFIASGSPPRRGGPVHRVGSRRTG